MEATTIDKLCSDVLEEIFSHLSASDLKNCALVCKAWNEVIGSSAVTMEKFKIGFRLDREGTSFGCRWWAARKGMVQRYEKSYRNYQNVEVNVLDVSLTQLPSLHRFIDISQVKTLNLHFESYETIQLNKLVKLFSRMSLLQKLTVVFGRDCAIDSAKTPTAHLKKLKQLNLQGFYHQRFILIFDFVKAENITELTYSTFAEYSDAEIDAVTEFIKSKKSLSKLNVSSLMFTQLLRRHDFGGMNLESLNVDSYRGGVIPVIVIENFRTSLIANADSLTSLTIPPQLISKEVIKVIFNRLRKLTTLDILLYSTLDDRCDDDGSWMKNLSPNDISYNLPLKNLKAEEMSIEGLKTILQRAPQLKKLWILSVTDVILKEVATSCPSVVELRIDFKSKNLTGDQRFNELKSLTIDIFMFVKVDRLASLLERCPKIEVLEFHHIWSCEKLDIFVEILLHQETLKHLRFYYCESAATRIIFDKLKSNYGNLKSLGIHTYNWKIINFDFPENPADWNVEEQEARFSAF